MIRMARIYTLIIILGFFVTNVAQSEDLSDFLILNDVGRYKLYKGFIFDGKLVGSFPEAINGGDAVNGYYRSYTATYNGGTGFRIPSVEVMVYESAEFLLHNLESAFRDVDDSEASPDKHGRIREINGNKIFYYGGGIVGYRWLNQKNVIQIEYDNMGVAKPEPLEVVKAYLAKFPSTIMLTNAEFQSKQHSIKWIKDEMDMRLVMSDRWVMLIQPDDDNLHEKLEDVIDNLNIFLDYRKRFFGVDIGLEKEDLYNLLAENKVDAIKARLTDYKTWWKNNKSNDIIL